MLDFDKIGVILTFNSTFLKTNVMSHSTVFHEKIIIGLGGQKI